jgi:glucose uptake protein
MVVVESYAIAVLMCVVTMLCWGSWANTQKLATKEWRFQLYYWDYAIGVLLFALLLAFTMGSMGAEGMGRSFLDDMKQASGSAIGSALLGGVIFNLANILLVAAIDVAGLAVAFPVGIGIALVLGVIVNYAQDPKGNAVLLALGVLGVTIAIIVDAVAYRRLPSQGKKTTGLGIGLSVVAGLSMGFFYRFVVAAMAKDFDKVVDGNVLLEAGKLSPYTAVVIFSVGLLISNFLWNSIVMVKPFVGDPVPFGDYFRKGNARLHLIGILGGIIWSIGMSFSIIASGPAGPAISYGLGQGATMVAAFWGVFIWKEFKEAPAGTSKLLNVMFASYLVGLVLIIAARLV